MRIALINSGIGLLAAAAELHSLRPDADLVLAMDPDGMPWGPRTPQDIAQRSLACAWAAADYRPDVLVLACNSGSVHALDALRAEFEPGIPVIGTVPAIKPAAAAADSVAIWATVATTASGYQRKLVAEHAARARVAPIACPGLADAVDAGDTDRIRIAVTDAASRTPADCRAVVLGCTEYELAADLIGEAVPGSFLFGSAAAVAAQTLRRAATADRHETPGRHDLPDRHEIPGRDEIPGRHDLPAGAGLPAVPAVAPVAGTLRVLLSGRPADLPAAALRYPAGRLLARLAPARDPDTNLPRPSRDAASPGDAALSRDPAPTRDPAPRRSVPA